MANGALTDQQMRAIFAKKRQDLEKLKQNPHVGLRAGEGSIPAYERAHADYAFSLLKRAAGQRDALHDAKKAKYDAEQQAKRDEEKKLEMKIKWDQELRRLAADKSITYAEFERRKKELESKVPDHPPPERKVLPSMELKQQEGESDEAFKEREKLMKQRQSQEKYFEMTKQPSPLFPSGASSASRHYNAATGKEYYTSSISPAEQRALGVETPVIEVPLDNLGNYVSIPAEKPPLYTKPEKPTAKSVEEAQQRKKSYEPRDSGSNNAEEFLGLLG